jgi:catechol 2,3-dioxygenase-like lactoylglutathione lyase family enzyme
VYNAAKSTGGSAGSTGPAMESAVIKDLWNIGVKVADLGREIDFLQNVGAEVVLRDRLSFAGEDREYAVLMLGGVRMLLFDSVVFQDRIEGGVRPGLTHAVYEVDDLDAEFARIRDLGADVLIEPTSVGAGFGARRIAFFRSPGGFVFEIMQVVERTI